MKQMPEYSTEKDGDWKPVEGYDGDYWISEDGRLWSNISNKMLKPHIRHGGYLMYCLCRGKERHWQSAHRLVAKAFIDNPENKPTVNHINEIKTDNRVVNLEWATFHEQNIHGTRPLRTSAKAQKIEIVQMAPENTRIRNFESISAAAKAMNLREENIVHCLKGRRKTCGGYQWKYA